MDRFFQSPRCLTHLDGSFRIIFSLVNSRIGLWKLKTEEDGINKHTMQINTLRFMSLSLLHGSGVQCLFESDWHTSWSILRQGFTPCLSSEMVLCSAHWLHSRCSCSCLTQHRQHAALSLEYGKVTETELHILSFVITGKWAFNGRQHNKDRRKMEKDDSFWEITSCYVGTSLYIHLICVIKLKTIYC